MVQIIKKSDKLNSMKIKATALDKETGFAQEFEFTHSKHSLERANKRGIKGLRLQLALIYGDSIRKQGYEYCILGEDRIPEQYLKQKDKLKNTVVVMDGSSDRIITCYVATEPYRHIKKKSKTLWSPRNVA